MRPRPSPDPPGPEADIPGTPGFRQEPNGRVWAFGHQTRGAIWFPLKSNSELRRIPDTAEWRRTGRRYFIVKRDGRLHRHYWELPDPIAEALDDCPF